MTCRTQDATKIGVELHELETCPTPQLHRPSLAPGQSAVATPTPPRRGAPAARLQAGPKRGSRHPAARVFEVESPGISLRAASPGTALTHRPSWRTVAV